ncbi:(d)CMP kinase [Rickettsiales bacterium]|nr:(d)CMP kinase [Rickettsiales bacterium]
MKKLLIAIDGPSSSGKSTIAKNLSNFYQIPFLNTGSLYRALAFLAYKNNLSEDKIDKIANLADQIHKLDLDSPEIHNEEIGKFASKIAQKPIIRKALFDLQINFKENSLNQYNGAILEGRDIGTIICPEADFKFFIVVDVQIRAKRRFEQLQKLNPTIEYENILKDLQKRDYDDKNRKIAPLIKADNAVEIDNSLDPKIILAQITKIINDQN